MYRAVNMLWCGRASSFDGKVSCTPLLHDFLITLDTHVDCSTLLFLDRLSARYERNLLQALFRKRE